jgi:hypothetical protein
VGVAVVGHGVDVAAGAFNATMSERLDDATSLGGGTATTSLVAIGPSVPARDNTIDRAHVGVACQIIDQCGARKATIAHRFGDRTMLELQATTAGDGAFTVHTPLTDDTVDRTGLGVTAIGDSMGIAAGATKTAIGSSLNDATRLGSGTTATRHGAIGPGVPVGDDAIDGARMCVACLLTCKGGACDTAITC